jgi:hypothetical protein
MKLIFLKIEYCVSPNWQREIKYECNIELARIADQSHLNYIALQYTIDAMYELSDQRDTDAQVKRSKMSTANNSKLKPHQTIGTMNQSIAINNKIKESQYNKKGIYQSFDLLSKVHLNSRLWLNGRKLFTVIMFNQLNDAGKAKGIDENIIKDFADIKYYIDKSLEETSQFIDTETRAIFMFIDTSLELVRGGGIGECADKIDDCLKQFNVCHDLSSDGVEFFLRASIFKDDLKLTINLLNENETNTTNDQILEPILTSQCHLQSLVFEKLKYESGEVIECLTDRKKSFLDNIAIGKGVANIYNKFLYYFVHLKLRIGSILMLKATATLNNNDWLDALNVLAIGYELNRVISERSLPLEIELSYKCAFCLTQLYYCSANNNINFIDIIDLYSYTIHLTMNSNHDLSIIRSSYLQIAKLFVSTFDKEIISISNGTIDPSQTKNDRQSSAGSLKSTSKSNTSKITPQMIKAMDGASTALAFATKTSNAMREKTLLPGHKALKRMTNINTTGSPLFVANDLLAYYVFAERKRIYRDEIEEEVLTLVPEFEPKSNYKTFDDKWDSLRTESDTSITWIHLFNYQAKLQQVSSMKNLNTLKNGKNRFKYSEFYTIGFTPIFKNINYASSRLAEIHKYLRSNLDVYKTECQAPSPVHDFFRNCARSLTNPSSLDVKSILKYSRIFENNISINLYSLSNIIGANANSTTSATASTTSTSMIVEETMNKYIKDTLSIDVANNPNTKRPVILTHADWSHLQIWPPNFNYADQSLQTIRINETTTSAAFVNYSLTLNWYKPLIIKPSEQLLCFISVKSPLTNSKIKYKMLNADIVHQIHNKLVFFHLNLNLNFVSFSIFFYILD